jgi:hypothetical protein
MNHRSLSLALAIGLLGFGCSQPPATMVDVSSASHGTYRVQGIPGHVPISSVGASSQAGAPHPYFMAGNIGDGTLTSAWAPASNDAAPSLIVEFANPAEVTDIAIKVSLGRNSRPAFHRVNVAVDAEGPNGTWAPIVSNWTPSETLLQLIGVAPRVTGRLRLRFSTPGADLADLLVCEVQATGTDAPDPVPSFPAPSPSQPVPSVSPSTAPSSSPAPDASEAPEESPGPSTSSAPDEFTPIEYGAHPLIYAGPWTSPETLITPTGMPPAVPGDPWFCGQMAGECVVTGLMKRDGVPVGVPVHLNLMADGNGSMAGGTLRVAVNPAFDTANFVFTVAEVRSGAGVVSLMGSSSDGHTVKAFVTGSGGQATFVELWIMNAANQPIFKLMGPPDEGTAMIQPCS